MKATRYHKLAFLMGAAFVFLLFHACERDLGELDMASYPNNPEVFIDGFSAGLNYAAFGGSVPAAFQVDNDVTLNHSLASMRFDVPNAGDPRGSYAGGVFFTEPGRDLMEYNALTFWARATQSATIDLIGFGNDLGPSRFEVSIAGVQVSTAWNKYIIPIPDPSKLSMEKGMLFYAEGPEDGMGYSFWLDEVKFEKLGTIAHPRHAIMNGENLTETSFTGASRHIGGLVSIFNMPTGIDQAVQISPYYLHFSSSDESIATVDEAGRVTVTGGPGTAVITASMGDLPAAGSLTIESVGQFQHAPTPVHPPENVISIFSDAYENVPVNYYNGYWAPWQTTQSADFAVNGDHILHYFDFNFVGIEFSSPTVNASEMTHLHIDIFIPHELSAAAQLRIELVDFGNGGTGLFTQNIAASQTQQWISMDIPLSAFAGLTSRTQLAQIIFVDVAGNISSFYADNIYFYKNQ